MNLIVTKIFCQSLDPLLHWGCTALNFIIFQKVGGGGLASPAPLLVRALVQSCPWSSHPPSPPSQLSLHSGNQWQKKLYFFNIQFIESVKKLFTYSYRQLRPCGICCQDHLLHMEIGGFAHISNTFLWVWHAVHSSPAIQALFVKQSP